MRQDLHYFLPPFVAPPLQLSACFKIKSVKKLNKYKP